MPRVPVETLNDPRIAIYRDLKTSNATRRLEQFVVEGQKLFERLIDSTYLVASILVSDRHEPLVTGLVPEHVPIYVVPEAQLSLLVGFNFHKGVLAAAYRRPWPKLADIAASAGERATIALCPRVDNPENLGALIRIADVFGIDTIGVGGRAPDPLSRRVLRVSMGTALHLPVVVSDNLAEDVERLRDEQGFSLAATILAPSATSLGDFARSARQAVVFGCEGHGLDPEWIARCDSWITIPMRPGAESLNLAVAAGIVLHHLTKPA